MDRSRIFLRLRITVSTVCGLICVLLIVLWIRSYRATDVLSGNCPACNGFLLQTSPGRLNVIAFGPSANIKIWWTITSGAPLKNRKPTPRQWTLSVQGFPRSTVPALFATIPMWGLVLASGAAAFLPWITRVRRFSLRMLLVATTLVAILLGILAYGRT